MIKLPSDVNIEELINDLRIISWEASEILSYYARILKDSDDKSNILKNENFDDPVTVADLKVNQIVIEGINKKYKKIDWGILSEESVKLFPKNSNIHKDWLWVLDPLDGTKDFIEGSSNYAMHLALNYKGKPYLGIVLIPEKDELWFAYENVIWGEKKNGSRIKPNLSKNKSLNEMILVTSKNHRNETLKKLIEKINFKKVITMGSIGCKIASIIRGESDLYICLSLPNKSSPKDWDFAAPEAILKASGGGISKINCEELNYGQINYEQPGIIIASNDKNMQNMVCYEIKEIIKKYEITKI